jgi:pyridoxine kinase
MNSTKKIACINDFTGFGRCSLAVALPILSVCGVQCCSLPTAVFSNHTGFESFFKADFTDVFEDYTNEWSKLSLHFDAIYSGYLGSPRQTELVNGFIDRFKTENTLIIVDPVMGDGGKLYKSFSTETAEGLKSLARRADILTPNLTEAYFLADMPYNAYPSDDELKKLAEGIDPSGVKKVVITGIETPDSVKNLLSVYGDIWEVITPKRAPFRSGTGDVFASIISAGAVRGMDFVKTVKVAADFVKTAAERSFDDGINETDGAVFEPFLYRLGECFAAESDQ